MVIITDNNNNKHSQQITLFLVQVVVSQFNNHIHQEVVVICQVQEFINNILVVINKTIQVVTKAEELIYLQSLGIRCQYQVVVVMGINNINIKMKNMSMVMKIHKWLLTLKKILIFRKRYNQVLWREEQVVVVNNPH